MYLYKSFSHSSLEFKNNIRSVTKKTDKEPSLSVFLFIAPYLRFVYNSHPKIGGVPEGGGNMIVTEEHKNI